MKKLLGASSSIIRRLVASMATVGLLLAVMFLSSCASPALHVAARKGNLPEVRRLLDAGADTEERCHPSLSATDLPLAAAAYKGHVEVVRLLLDRGADINGQNNLNARTTALMWAQDPRIVSLLLERGADIEARDGWGNTALDKIRRYPVNTQKLALLEAAERKKIIAAAVGARQREAGEQQEQIRVELEGAGLVRLLEKPPENGVWAEALTKALIQAKNKELPGFLVSASLEDRVALLTTVELRLSDAQALMARLTAMAEDAVRQGQSAVPLRDQVGKIQVYNGILMAIRNMLLQS